MIIMKFGGTSVKDAEAMERVAGIITYNLKKQPVVVVSAMAGITDLLETSMAMAAAQSMDRVRGIIHQIKRRHEAVIDALFGGTEYARKLGALTDNEINKLNALLDATKAIRFASADLSHAILSIGEILSSHLLNTLLHMHGSRTATVDARDIIITHHPDEGIRPIFDEIKERAGKRLLPLTKDSEVVVTQGFIAATTTGIPTTLGRNGSDLTASLLGAAIGAEEIEIWTDVDGILSADPTIIPSAQPLDFMTYNEACELAYFGARVLYPAAIQPALEQDIPVRIRNTHLSEAPGTRIVVKNCKNDPRVVKSIAYKEGITLVTLESSQLLLSTQMLADLFQRLSQHDTRVYAVSKSATKISITVENRHRIPEILAEIKGFGNVEVQEQKAIVTVVGENMNHEPDLAWQIIRLVRNAGISIDLISQFASQISFMFIINESDIRNTVELLHRQLIETGHQMKRA